MTLLDVKEIDKAIHHAMNVLSLIERLTNGRDVQMAHLAGDAWERLDAVQGSVLAALRPDEVSPRRAGDATGTEAVQ